MVSGFIACRLFGEQDVIQLEGDSVVVDHIDYMRNSNNWADLFHFH